ncbi:MAG: hypothetical protein QXG98_00745 [Candidatus Micrarchaeia archaeon]
MEPKPRRKTLLDEIAESMGERIAPAQPSPPTVQSPPPAEEKPHARPLRAELVSLQKRLRALFKLERRAGEGGAALAALRQHLRTLSAELEQLERTSSDLRLSIQLAEEEAAKLRRRKAELAELVASLKETFRRRSRELQALQSEVKSLSSQHDRLQKKLEQASERVFDLEGKKVRLERKLREVEALISSENAKLAALRAREAELTRLINLSWEVVRQQDEEKKRLADLVERLQKEKALYQAHAERAGGEKEDSEGGITDTDTLRFLASVKYSEHFDEEEARQLTTQGFVRVQLASNLTRALLKKAVGERPMEFFIVPRSHEPEKDLACWLLTVLLSDHARDVVSNGGAFDISFLPPSGSDDGRYAVEVSLHPPSGDELLARLRKLAWARDYVVLADDSAAEVWRKKLAEPSRVVSAHELEQQELALILSRLKGFAGEAGGQEGAGLNSSSASKQHAQARRA